MSPFSSYFLYVYKIKIFFLSKIEKINMQLGLNERIKNLVCNLHGQFYKWLQVVANDSTDIKKRNMERSRRGRERG